MSFAASEFSRDPFGNSLLLTGTAFFENLCRVALEVSGAHLACIGSLRIVETEEIEVLACSSLDPNTTLTHYDASRSPCQQVLQDQQIIVHTQGLQDLFPKHRKALAKPSHSYVGFPLLDRNGHTIGLLALEWDRPITEEDAANIIKRVRPVLSRLENEVGHHIVSHAFEVLLTPVDTSPDPSETLVFRTVVMQAAALAKIHSAVLTQCVDHDARQFRILAVVSAGEILPQYEGLLLPYSGTPCAGLRSKNTVLVPRDLRQKFPDLDLYNDLGAVSYCGFGFRDRSHNPIGHLALLHNRPIAPRMLQSQIVNIIAARAEQELQRHIIDAERKSLANALALRKKLDSLGLMAGTLAHDFNNQLTAILGHTEMAMLDLAEHHPAHSRLKLAENSLWRARDVISDLMDFASKTHRPPPTPQSLNEIITQDLAGLDHELHQNSKIEADLEPTLPLILGRPSQIHQIVNNLALNALDAIEGTDGTLRLRTAMTDLPKEEVAKCLTGHCAELASPCVLLEISDTGRGMDAETVKHIFDPFFSTKAVSRGLGLAGVLSIARRLPAGLTLETAPGSGTTFRLYFRPEEHDPEQQPKPHVAKPFGKPAAAARGTILVADDEKVVVQTVCGQLSNLGFTPIEARNGQDALRLAAEAHDLCAVVLDVVMPGQDGWSTLEALRKTHQDIPAVLMSGYDQSSVKEHADALGSTQVLTKPFSLYTLSETLDQLLQ